MVETSNGSLGASQYKGVTSTPRPAAIKRRVPLARSAAAVSAASQAQRRSSVRSLERGLALLQIVNEEGGIRPSDAARLLQLPRPTAHRLLETLEELGYVRRSPSDNRFFVTIKARRLSGGYDTDIQLSEVVGPVLSQLLIDLVWPVNIATHRAGMMVVRETTHSRSPLSVDRDMVGREVPILRTATGRAYLAFCPEQERQEILQCIRTQADPDDEPYLIAGAVEEMLARCRRDGYGARLSEAYVPRTSSIALPIKIDGYAIACISVVWLSTSIAPSRAIKLFLPRLRDVAAMLGRRLESAQWTAPGIGRADGGAAEHA